jgi:aromatic-L-amino-acid decarboxylase
MDLEAFRVHAHLLVDRMADYLETVEARPVRSTISPGTLAARLPNTPPAGGESFETILADVEELIEPRLTHWQHPRFFAYFQANASPPSVLAEMLVATWAQQAMLWETSPAANELEAVTMGWLRRMIDLPDAFTGTIQDSASTANLVALLVGRERALDWAGNATGLAAAPPVVVYTSEETHSSVAKAARVAGFGDTGTRTIPLDSRRGMDPSLLDAAMREDEAAGRRPACVVATFGSTSVGAMDPLEELAAVCARHGVFLHVDAAWAGSALILPEVRALARGIDEADSVVFNPHKWLLTNFDCSAHFVRDPDSLLRTLSVLPAYLKSDSGGGPEYRDWTIPLGRRFRALKLWFVLRSYGVEGLRAKIRGDIFWAKKLEAEIDAHPDFEVVTPRSLSLIAFRYRPPEVDNPGVVDAMNERLAQAVNDDGFLYLTRTRVDDRPVLRLVVGQTYTREEHVRSAWERIVALSRQLPGAED